MMLSTVKPLVPVASEAQVAGRGQVWQRFLTALPRALAVSAA
jgi:hypothetical protein